MFNFFSVFLYSIFVSLMCDFASPASANQEESVHQRDINTISMKLNEKFDFLNEKMMKLELDSSTGNSVVNEDEILGNVTQMWKVLEQVFNKFDNFEQQLFKKIDQLEQNDKPALKVFVIQLGEISHQEVNEKHSKNDVVQSECESKINNWANQTRDQFRTILEKLESITPVMKDDESTTNESLQKVSYLCNSNPCLNGGRCEVILNGTDYQCSNCPNRTIIGKRCQNFICEESDKCFQHRDKVYRVYETNLIWEEAKQKCLSQGMRLATPKDKETNEFLVNRLRIVYKAQIGRVRFWFGLKNHLPQQKWQWVDGSPLGEYNGGRTDNITGYRDLRAGALALDVGGIQFWACHQLLDQLDDFYQMYPLCEQNYST